MSDMFSIEKTNPVRHVVSWLIRLSLIVQKRFRASSYESESASLVWLVDTRTETAPTPLLCSDISIYVELKNKSSC